MTEQLRQYDPKIVKEVLVIFLKHCTPNRIYLFGTRVTGDAKTDSRFAIRVRDTGLAVYSATKALRAQDGLMYFERALERFCIAVNKREEWIAEGNGDIVLDVEAKTIRIYLRNGMEGFKARARTT